MEKKFWELGKLQVSQNGRYLQNGEHPFFWMGDTAWLLFQKCTTQEAYTYLRNRKEKKYSVIQATLVHCLSGNAIDRDDPSSPEYWEHCDQIISIAEELGLYMALLPCWGSFVSTGLLTVEKALQYADFLHARYKDRPNIIWIMGGDVRGDKGLDVFNSFGSRMRELFPDLLVGYHPFGRTDSSYWFHNEHWLDFNMFQSGHRRYDQKNIGNWDDTASGWENYSEDNWKYVNHDAALTPRKPTVDAEPSYEWIVQGLHDKSQPYWQAPDVRRYAYWPVLQGAMGHTYGDNSIMQFYKAPQTKGAFGVKEYWQASIHHEGSGQMTHLVDLMTSVDFVNGKPAEDRLSWGQKEQYHRISVFEGPDYLICYDYLGEEFALNLESLSDQKIEGWWMNPETGSYSYLGTITPSAETVFQPTPKYTGANDWVLLLRY